MGLFVNLLKLGNRMQHNLRVNKDGVFAGASKATLLPGSLYLLKDAFSGLILLPIVFMSVANKTVQKS